MRRVKRALLGLVALAAIGGVLAATGVLSSAVDALPESDCPYGSTGTQNQSGCKPRPKPSESERAAVRDGSALASAIRAFGAKKKVVGIGLNRWGETTFTTTADKKHVTFDRKGGKPPQSKPQARSYELATYGTVGFTAASARPAAIRRAIARIGDRGTFQAAALGQNPVGLDTVWLLRYTRDEADGFLFRMDVDGGGLCQLAERAAVRGIARCALEIRGVPGATLPTPAPAPSTVAPSAPPAAAPPQSKQLECVQQAGTDVTKLQACVGKP